MNSTHHYRFLYSCHGWIILLHHPWRLVCTHLRYIWSSFVGVSELVAMVQFAKEEFGENTDLDEKWRQMARKLLNENDKTTEALLEEFEAEIASCEDLEELTDNDILTDRQFLIRWLLKALHSLIVSNASDIWEEPTGMLRQDWIYSLHPLPRQSSKLNCVHTVVQF